MDFGGRLWGMDNDFFKNLPADPWAVVGHVVKARRERLGLKQEELKQYAGPGVSTVGKVERAAQESFPLRTQHAIENALGWERGSVESLIRAIELADDSWWGNQDLRESYLEEMVEDEIPDLSSGPGGASPVRRAAELTDDELLTELTYRMKRYGLEKEDQDGSQTPPEKTIVIPEDDAQDYDPNAPDTKPPADPEERT